MTGFSRRAVLGGGSAMAIGLAASGAESPQSMLPGSIEAAIDAAVATALKAGACPGVAVAVSSVGGLQFSKGYGLANLETATAVSAQSVFRIGSLSKQFTAAAIVELSAQGRLELDDPVFRHLDFFARLETLSVRELLNHTAGLHSDETGPVCLEEKGPLKSQIDLARGIAAQAKPFDFPPGTAWLYSNANYIVLGAVIEKVTAKPLADAMQALIFTPLRLENTAFDNSAAVVPGRVSGYTPREAAGDFVQAAYIPIEQTGGAGAIRSTVGDLCAWHRHLLGGRLFDEAHVKSMATPGRLRDGRLSGDRRFAASDASYGETQYGFGLLIPPPVKGHDSILHYGAINGFAACLESYVDLGLTLAVLCNADMNPALPIRPIRHVVIDQVL